MDLFERSYGKILGYTLMVANPFKKAIIRTQCKVHKHINRVALGILLNDGYVREHRFFSKYLGDLNDGAVWADQDFKSIGHFYNPHKRKGLYGNKNAMDLAVGYYNQSLNYAKRRNMKKSMFYLGAAVHLVQDMTIAQHANIRLLDNHKQYETFIKKSYLDVNKYVADEGSLCLDSIENFIKFNARVTLQAYKKFKKIKITSQRFEKMLSCGLPLAQRTTAGCLLMYYYQTSK